MTAPVAAARGTPDGIKLDDGHSTKVTIGPNPTVSFWEKTVQPPGLDGGDAIETTTMFNVTYRTMAARALMTLTEMSLTAAYDPNVYNDVIALINVETTITVRFPDGSTLAFYGYLKAFEPQEVSEGEQPEANVTIVPTNFDPSAKTEEAPVLTSVPGT